MKKLLIHLSILSLLAFVGLPMIACAPADDDADVAIEIEEGDDYGDDLGDDMEEMGEEMEEGVEEGVEATEEGLEEMGEEIEEGMEGEEEPPPPAQ